MGLDKHELITVLNERRQKVIGRNKVAEWWRESRLPIKPCGGLETFGVEPACCFWYSKEGEQYLPDCAVFGLRSMIHVGKLNPRLCVYQDFANVPQGVQVVDARELLAVDEFDSLLTKCGGRICLLADYVRLCDLERIQHNVAWFCDVDTLWTKDARSFPVNPQGFGHLISTMDMRPGCLGGADKTAKRHMMKFAKAPGDEAYMATPLRFPRTSPLLAHWIATQRDILFGVQPVTEFDHIIFMNALKDSVDHFGLNDACVPTSTFSPLPYYLANQVLSAKHVKKMKPAISILDEAYGVNAFWQSSRGKNVLTGNQRGAHSRAERGSVWSNLLVLVEEKIRGAMLDNSALSQTRVIRRRYREKLPDRSMQLAPSIPWPISTFSMPTMPSMQGTDFRQSPIYNTYALTKQLGEGTNGIVFLAQHTANFGQVAIKCSKNGSPSQALDMMEIYYHAALSQTNSNDSNFIVKLLDAWASPFLNVLVLEKMDADCWGVITAHRDRKLEVVTALHVLLQAARGVALVHGLGIMHRDLHARNVLLNHTWDSALSQQMQLLDVVNVKLGDFGAATNIGSDALSVIAKASARCGARDVMPPELLYRKGVEWEMEEQNVIQRGSSPFSKEIPERRWRMIYGPSHAAYNQKVDIWALGALLMCMLRGGVYQSHRIGAMAFEMSGPNGMCGRVPPEVSKKYGWSVPQTLLAKFGAAPSVDFKSTCQSHDDRAAGVLRHVWAYDPESRPQARDLVDALVVMLLEKKD